MSGQPEDFVERLKKEDRAPALTNPLTGARTGRAFTVREEDDPANPYAQEIQAAKYDLDHDVYVIWRPYNTCFRCMSKLRAKPPQLELPDDGDYVCPHTRRTAYRTILAERAAGVVRFTSYESTTLKDGTIQVSIGLARPKSKEEMERNEAQRGRANRF